VAVASAKKRKPVGRDAYRAITFAELAAQTDAVARGLIDMGVAPGTRLVLMVRAGIEFVELVFALLKCGAVPVLIDPGMGRKGVLDCLEELNPEGFVAVSIAQAFRRLFATRFSDAHFNVTVGRRWFWGGPTLEQLRNRGARSNTPLPETSADDPAAIIFTSGSTGPAKGVLYTHRNFDTQVIEIRDRYAIQPGEVDLAGFPLFGLFNAAMGVTTVFPDMDPSRPARVDPKRIVQAAQDWEITQAFASPAMWNVVSRYCESNQVRLPTLRRVLSAGAPVPATVVRRMTAAIAEEGQMHTPYGATEALPVATISAQEVLSETAEATEQGAGVCVGTKFASIEWKVIRIGDGPIEEARDCEPLPEGEIGELIVRGPQVTSQYVTQTAWNALSKVDDGEHRWHRMGDVGYFDSRGRFWFCGRKSHRVKTATATLYPVRCEAIFNTHPAVYRTALVGVGFQEDQLPFLYIEPESDRCPENDAECERLIDELRALGGQHRLTESIQMMAIEKSLPVDPRHNSKIFREQLAASANVILMNDPQPNEITWQRFKAEHIEPQQMARE